MHTCTIVHTQTTRPSFLPPAFWHQRGIWKYEEEGKVSELVAEREECVYCKLYILSLASRRQLIKAHNDHTLTDFLFGNNNKKNKNT